MGAPRKQNPFGIGTSEPPRPQRVPAHSTVRRLSGGPLDGKIAETSGRCPAVLLGPARDPGLFETIEEEARWNPATEWYEVPAS